MGNGYKSEKKWVSGEEKKYPYTHADTHTHTHANSYTYTKRSECK